MSTWTKVSLLKGVQPLWSNDMPRKYQNGKLEVRRDVKRPYYCVQVTSPKILPDGTRRGVRERVSLGFVDEITRKAAMKARAELLEKVNAPRMLARSEMRFGEVLTRFLAVRVPQLGTAVQQRYPSQIKNHILPAFGALKMSEIDRPAVEAWLNVKRDAGLAPWTLTGLKGLLSAIFTTAKAWRVWEGDNPCEGIRVKKRCVREKRKLTGEQMLLILSALDERERFIVQILFGLGLRISECLGLRWSDIDFDNGVLEIRRRWYRGDISEDGQNKTDAATRTLQMGRFLTEEFRRRYPGPHRQERFVFVGEDENLPPDDRDLLREYFRPIVRRLGLHYKGFGWHAFRREAITMRQQAGATPIEAMKAAGHTSIGMTALYTLPDPVRERAQVDAMFAGLMGEGTKQ